MDDSLFFCLCGQEVVHGDGGDVYGNLHIEQGKSGEMSDHKQTLRICVRCMKQTKQT